MILLILVCLPVVMLSIVLFFLQMNVNKIIQNEPRKSKRKRKAKDFGPDFYSFMLEDDPKTFGEAMRSIDAPF